MARVALIKLFTGLNLGVSQLARQLQRAGHDTRIIYFKDFIVLPADATDGYPVTDYALTNVAARGREYVWNCYTPFSEREYALLFAELERFPPDLIGLSLTSPTMQPAEEVTARLKQRFPTVPVIWGGAGVDPLLPSLPFHFLMDEGDAQTTDVLNLPHAQAMLPGARAEQPVVQ